MTTDDTIKPDGYVSDWFGDLFKDLAEAYPSMKVRAGQVKVYAQALQDLSPEQIRSAMGRAILESKWFPSVAELRSYVAPLSEDAAILAWAAFDEAARTVGAWQSLEIEDACAAAALQQIGGWPVFCALEDGPAKTVARQTFLVAFRDARRRGKMIGAPVRLAGLAEAQGRYERIPASWVGRLTLDGRVEHERERPALPSGAAVKQLTTGETRSDDGEEGQEQADADAGGEGAEGRPDQAADRAARRGVARARRRPDPSAR